MIYYVYLGRCIVANGSKPAAACTPRPRQGRAHCHGHNHAQHAFTSVIFGKIVVFRSFIDVNAIAWTVIDETYIANAEIEFLKLIVADRACYNLLRWTDLLIPRFNTVLY